MSLFVSAWGVAFFIIKQLQVIIARFVSKNKERVRDCEFLLSEEDDCYETEKVVKDQAEEIFNELGLNMTTAINMFLRTAIREHGIPFDLKLDVPNDTTAAAIEGGRK